MQKLNNQVDRLVNLIRDLLDTTRIAEGKLQLELETQDLNELIGEKVEELQRISEKHKIIFAPGKLQHLAFDRERIGQVITNLVSNAVKYSPGADEVKIVTESAGEHVRVSVIDRGLGIPEDARPRIFDRFYRVENRKNEALPGMGLGLYISAAIVRRHGGSISVDSQPGKGSVFSFTLPLNAVEIVP
jgi:signal transduction histidine kinase